MYGSEQENLSNPSPLPRSKSSFGVAVVVILLLLLTLGFIYFLFKLQGINKQISDLKIQAESFQQSLDNGFVNKEGDRIIGDTNGDSTTLNLDNSTLTANPNQNATVRLGDSNGYTSFVIQNSNGLDVASISSTGNFGLDGKIICTNCIALGSQTMGNYVKSLIAGTDIAISDASGEGVNPTIFNNSTLNSVMSRGSSTNYGLTFNDPNSILAFNGGAGRLYDSSGSLFYNGINLTAGGALPAGISGQTIYNNGTNWITSSNLYNSGTNIGIGTVLPVELLEVAGDALATRLISRQFFNGLNIDLANSDIVEAAGYDAIDAGAADWGGGTTERHFLNNYQKSRIRQNGIMTRVSFYLASKPAQITNFYIEVWRKDGSTWDRISQEEIWSQTTAGAINYINLATPVAVREGDYIGYGWTSSASPGNFSKAITGSAGSSYYITDTNYTTTDYNWSAGTANINFLPIKAYMQAPMMAFIGDSIIAGHTSHYSFIEATSTTDIDSTIEWNLGNALNYTYQNMGIGGQTTTTIANRFTADVVNLKPKIAVIEGGVNDISGGVTTKATFLANWTSMLDACEANNIIPVVIKILPWTNGTNGQMQTRDDWNADLTTLAQSYSNAIVVDASSYVGQYRPGGDTGNLWDIRPIYDSGGVHFTSAGHAKIAQAIADAIAKTTIKGGAEIGSLLMRGIVDFSGETGDRYLSVQRNPGYEQTGAGLNITAGGSTILSTDKNGGTLTLSSGTSTGTGSSRIAFYTVAAGATGTSDSVPVEVMSIGGNGTLYFGSGLDTNLYRSAADTLKTDDNLGLGVTATYQLETSKTIKAGTAMYANTRALDFDGNNDYVDLGNITELNSVANFTVSTWIKQDVVPAIDRIFYRQIDTNNSINLNTSTTGNALGVYVRNGSSSYGNLDNYQNYITAGRWYHIVAVYDGAGATNADKLKLYIDGAYVAFTSFAGIIPATTANLSSVSAHIGQSTNAFDGQIQDLRIYNSSLAASNIATIYQGGTYTTNMVHQYKLMEGSGLVATDTGSNVMNGTISGATWGSTGNTGIQTDFGRGALTLAPNTTNAKDGLWFGYDVNLYRSGAYTLKADNNLVINSPNTTGTTTSSSLSLSANSLTSGTGLYAASSTLSSGSLVDLAVTGTTAASNTQKALNISTSGANATSTQTTYGAYIANTHTGTASTNVGLYTSASGGTNNYGLIVASGNVGIGTTAPTYQLETTKTVKAGTAMYANTRALDFDGNNDYVSLGDITELTSTANVTVSAWVKQDVTPETDIIFRKQLTTSSRFTIQMSTSNNSINVYPDNSVNFVYASNYQNYMTAGRWHHVVVVYDGTQTDADIPTQNLLRVKIYVDGVLRSDASSGTIPATTSNTATATAYIGWTSSAFDGGIQDLRIYSSSVAASDIATIYQGGTYTTNMVHQYKLMEGSGLVATDTGSNVMNGTISGATWSSTNNVGIQTDFGRGALTLAPNTTNAKDGIWFGYDNNLYRSANLVISSNSKLDPASLNLQTKAGIPADGDITGGAADGDIVLDTSNNRIYTRTGGSWMYAALSAGFQIPNFEAYTYDFTSKSFDISKPIKQGDLLIPFADYTMSDGAIHGLYTTFDSVKQTMFNSFEQDYDTLASNYIATKSDNALTKIDSNLSRVDAVELSFSDLRTKVDALSADTSFIEILRSYFVIDEKQNLSLPANLNLSGSLTTAGLTIENQGENNKTIGQATIFAGETFAVISTTAVSENSRIFVTARSKTADPLFVTEIDKAQSFKVEINSALENDLMFDWWIIEEKQHE